jgi:hypothetical protein
MRYLCEASRPASEPEPSPAAPQYDASVGETFRRIFGQRNK